MSEITKSAHTVACPSSVGSVGRRFRFTPLKGGQFRVVYEEENALQDGSYHERGAVVVTL